MIFDEKYEIRRNVVLSYIDLIFKFVSGKMSGIEFETEYLRKFKNEQLVFGDDVYNILNELFSDVDCYCSDPTIIDSEDIDECLLRSRAEKALCKLKRGV